jgi:hypothetical protein
VIPEVDKEAITLGSGGRGLPTCQVSTILDMRQQYAEEALRPNAWKTWLSGQPNRTVSRLSSDSVLLPLMPCIGDHRGGTHRASGRVIHDGAAGCRDADGKLSPRASNAAGRRDRFHAT